MFVYRDVMKSGGLETLVFLKDLSNSLLLKQPKEPNEFAKARRENMILDLFV